MTDVLAANKVRYITIFIIIFVFCSLL
jgi:hypothetical protein